MKNADYWIEKLRLLPHPEGGYYRETYRSTETLGRSSLPGRFSGDRAVSTAIYFLIKEGGPSVFHRIRSDEIWHFYAGSAVTIHLLEEGRGGSSAQLGPDPDRGDLLQFCVPALSWFGAEVSTPGGYALVGCTVSPGFDFADFELGERSDLLSLFPEAHGIIEKLTPSKVSDQN